MLAVAKEYFVDLYRLFYPNLCGGCDEPLVKGEKHLCIHCRLDLPFTNFEKIQDNPVEKVFYGRVPLQFATSLLYFSKGEKTQQILHNIKYNGKRELAVFMGRLLGERLQKIADLSDITCIIPVPLHPQKEHIRGYNQSALFAEGVNEILKCKLLEKVIKRDIFTETQTKKGRVERWENVAHAFKVQRPNLLHHQHILLVDDVLTTGATLEACAVALLSAGNCKVSIATIAFAKN